MKYANVTSTLALVAALATGGAYAATELGRGSVGSRELRDRSVHPVDLAPSARPLAKAALREVVQQVISDPTAGLTIKVQGGKWDKGDAGPQGPAGPTGAKGDSGLQGEQGAKGDPGAPGPSRSYGHIKSDLSGPRTNITSVTSPGLNLYCMVLPAETTSLVITPDVYDAQPYVLEPGAAGTSCAAGRWQIALLNNHAEATGFFFVAN